jgi:hypothetical protein
MAVGRKPCRNSRTNQTTRAYDKNSHRGLASASRDLRSGGSLAKSVQWAGPPGIDPERYDRFAARPVSLSYGPC